MSELLALKYRPKRFSEISGQVATRLVLTRMLSTNQVPQGVLFTGPKGSGKTSSARILAAGLNCCPPFFDEDPKTNAEKPCGECESCLAIQERKSLTVIEMDAASNGGVSDIRELRNALQYRGQGRNRIVILDEAHSMSREAFDALLKVLEEAPEATTFILVTTAPNKLPATIRSRLMQFEFRVLSELDIFSRLTTVCIEESCHSNELMKPIAKRAKGDMRQALNLLDQCIRAQISKPEHFDMLLGEPDFGPELIRVMMTGNLADVFDRIENALASVGDPVRVSDALVATLRDVLVLRAAGKLVEGSPDALGGRAALAGHLDTSRAFGALRLCWQLRSMSRAQENPRTALDLTVVMMTEQLSGVLSRAEKKAATVNQPMSLGDMGRM